MVAISIFSLIFIHLSNLFDPQLVEFETVFFFIVF